MTQIQISIDPAVLRVYAAEARQANMSTVDYISSWVNFWPGMMASAAPPAEDRSRPEPFDWDEYPFGVSGIEY